MWCPRNNRVGTTRALQLHDRTAGHHQTTVHRFLVAVSTAIRLSHASDRLPLKPRPHQQQCRSNIVEWYKSNYSFDKVETYWTCLICVCRLCRKDDISFDIVTETGNIVAKNGNNVEATFDFVERMKFYDKLVRHCCRFGNKVECCFDKVKRCFDIVAGVDGLNDGRRPAQPLSLRLISVATIFASKLKTSIITRPQYGPSLSPRLRLLPHTSNVAFSACPFGLEFRTDVNVESDVRYLRGRGIMRCCGRQQLTAG